jgi:hypothetical protein
MAIEAEPTCRSGGGPYFVAVTKGRQMPDRSFFRVMNLIRNWLERTWICMCKTHVVRAGLWHGRVLILALAFVDRIALFRFRLPASQIQGRKTNTEFWHWAQADRH